MVTAAFKPVFRRICAGVQRSVVVPVAVYLASLALCVLVAAAALERVMNALGADVRRASVAASRSPSITAAERTLLPPASATKLIAMPRGPQSTVEKRIASYVPTNDDWANQLQDPNFWAKRRNQSQGYASRGPSSLPSRLGAQPLPPGADGFFWFFGLEQPLERPRETLTYRTVCVRLCDGYYAPVSFSTTRENFETDARRCEASCGSQARLFVYRNPGADPDDMEDLKGNPYKRLPNAFRYRTSYDADCKCRPHAWEEASRDRHKLYALEAARAKGDRVAGREAEDLARRIRQSESDAAATKRAAARQAQREPRGASTPPSRRPAVSAPLPAADRREAEAVNDPYPAPRLRNRSSKRATQRRDAATDAELAPSPGRPTQAARGGTGPLILTVQSNGRVPAYGRLPN